MYPLRSAMMCVMAWRGWRNAEIYDRFVREHRVYRKLNQRLVELADLVDVKRVLDLGCGTGATALACLRVLDMEVDLVGVDASEEMVEVARANILDPRARFEVATAASVAEVTTGPFDRAVCNAAFWQFPAPGPVLAAVSSLLEDGGTFTFNIPAERVKGEKAPVHTFQVALARAIESRTGSGYVHQALPLDTDMLERLAEGAGLVVDGIERFNYSGKQSEFMVLMSIPAMIKPLTPGMSDDERGELLEEAARNIDPDETVEVPWVYFMTRKTIRFAPRETP